MSEVLDLSPGKVNIIAYRGDDFNRDVLVQDTAGDGYAISNAKMQVKDLTGSVALTLSVGSGITITNPGTIALYASKTTMAGLSAVDYRYDLQVTFTASGNQRTLLTGTFTVMLDITQ